MAPGTKSTPLYVVLAMLSGCGGTTKSPAAPAALSDASDGGTATTAMDAARRERPFAKTAADAQSLISDAVEEQHKAIFTCVTATRTRRNEPHAKIQVNLAIDQEGHLVGVQLPPGVTVSASEDKLIVGCIRDALSPALFPTSLAGIITMKKTFEDVNGVGKALK